MKDFLKSFGKQILFWLLFFALARIIFFLFYLSYLENVDFLSILAVFWHGLHLDISTVGFILLIPFIILSIRLFLEKNWLMNILKIYHFILVAIYSLITTGEIGIYGDWLTKLNSKAIKYLSHPGEIYNSSSTSTFFVLLLILLVQIAVGCFAYSKWFHHFVKGKPRKYLYSVLLIIISAFVLFAGLRGGFQQIPINQSSAYFSKSNILNQVAVNPMWNLFHSIHQNYYSIEKNPFIFYSDGNAKRNVTTLFAVENDTTEIILNNSKPNIFFIILEGWSSGVVGSLGGEKGITDGFDSLAKDGLLFTNCYAPGFRSDQGMACIFSGFPATPLATITRQPDKFSKLPFLTQRLIKSGYHTSFLFGGQLEYGNIKGYIYSNGFGKITECDNFSSYVPRGKLGVHDEFIYPQVLSDLRKEQQPFFTAVFTSSSHTPYDYPKQVNRFHFELESEYANAVYYSDSCLNDFFTRARKEDWYKNTLFIVVADHGHGSTKLHWDWMPELQKIPFLLYGDVIKEEFRGQTFDMPVSQVDIASTLLHQLGQESKEFRWSKNLFNPSTKPFAYYAFEVGLGFVTREGYFTYDCNRDTIPYTNIPLEVKDSIVRHGKSYLQELYQEYFEY